MNTADETTQPLDDHLLDRLVDGEATETERRMLLARFDSEPGGWRRCALAFLEAQSWREALGPLATAAAGPSMQSLAGEPTSPPFKRPSQSRWRLPRLSIRSSVEMAAALLLAFSLGISVGGMSRPLTPDRHNKNVAGANPLAPAQVESLATPDRVESQTAPDGVPVLVGAGVDERWIRRQPAALPEYVQRQWERKGYQVEQRRRLVSLDLQGGERLAIPVDEVELHYVGAPVY